MSVQANAMRSVDAARRDHDRTCRYKGVAVEVHLHPPDADKLGWEDGEDICGLAVKRDAKVPPKRLRVFCDYELHGGGLSEKESERVSATSTTTVPSHA